MAFTCCRYRSTLPPFVELVEATANIGRAECQVKWVGTSLLSGASIRWSKYTAMTPVPLSSHQERHHYFTHGEFFDFQFTLKLQYKWTKTSINLISIHQIRRYSIDAICNAIILQMLDEPNSQKYGVICCESALSCTTDISGVMFLRLKCL